MVDELRTAQ